MTGDTISALLGHLDALSSSALKAGLDQLRAEHDYLMALAPFQVGDRVVIDRKIDFEGARGWWASREILIPGATGRVAEVTFSRLARGWVMQYKPDVAWDVTSLGRRYHCHLPGGDDHTYAFRLGALRHACDHDAALERPADATCWGHSCGVQDHQSWMKS